MNKQRNYKVTIINIGRAYRWQIKASNGNIVNHLFETKASATKSLNAFLKAIREGRLVIDGQEPNG